jgi:phage portal protein BeeE
MNLKERLRSVLRGHPLPLPRKGSGFMTMLTPNPEIDLEPIKTRQQKLEAFVGWVYAAVSVIMTDVGQASWNIVTRKGERPEDTEFLDPRKIPGHFRRPNDFSSFRDAIELTQLHLDLVGEAFWHLLTPGDGSDEVIGFEVVYPHWIDDPIVREGRLVGWRVVIPGATGHREIAARDMIFFRYPHPLEPLCGMSPVAAIALSHELDQQARAYGAGLLKNNAIPPILITTEQELDPGDADIIGERWKDRHLLRPGEPGVLGKGATAKILGLTLAQIGLDSIDKMTRSQVFGSYGVPESKKGLVEDVNRANALANEITYQRNVIKPRLFRLAWGINVFLIPRIPSINGFEFRFDNPVSEDMAFQLEKVDTMIQRGMITINQGLNMLGEMEQDNGNVFLIPKNVERVPADQLDTPTFGPELQIKPSDRGSHMFEPVEFELAELKFLHRQGNVERRMISTVRVLFSVQQKKVVKAFRENAEEILGPRSAPNYVKDWESWEDEEDGRSLSIPTEVRQAVDQAIEEDRERWIEELAILILISIEAGWAIAKESIGEVAVDFNLIRAKAVEFADRHAAAQVGKILDTTKGTVNRIIALGIEDKRSIEIIADQLRKSFDVMKGGRAAAIARTETSAAVNHGMLETAKETRTRRGVEINKIWLTILDGNCRDDHCRAHRQEVRVDDHFVVGSSFMQRPHDPSAPAGQVINCRCSMVFKKVKVRR